MAKIIGSPTRYIQGKGEIKKLGEYASVFGKNLFLIIDKNIKNIILPDIEEGIKDITIKSTIIDFNGECSMSEINRIKELVKENDAEVIIGIGGGKSHDTAKAVAYYEQLPVVIVPTVASTDAPCSSLSVIYTDQGVFEKYLFLPSSPNMVLVDTKIVCNAPVRLLAAGIGDALATWFEARACERSDALNCLNGHTTKAALSLAKLCYDTLLADGVQAILAVKNHLCTKAVENIIEANTYLSGIGFESGGLAGAHAVHNGLTALEETHSLYHGEKVAFGTIVQLILENAPKKEIEEVIAFCQVIGLPTTLEELNVKEINEEKIMEVAKLVCSPNDTIGNMPFEVQPEDVYAAILGADQLGRYYKK